jgi:hypothetical protein
MKITSTKHSRAVSIQGVFAILQFRIFCITVWYLKSYDCMNEIIILALEIYGCLIPRENRIRVFEKAVLRRILGHKREEVIKDG